ncbi:MAG: Fic family protein [Thermodesulfobacteriota bacterium]|nr:Fic family protein [Thermodesulfobacteriota bacterium]
MGFLATKFMKYKFKKYDVKYKMEFKENIFYAKRYIVDFIYSGAKIEGCNVTFPQTKTIIDGVSVGGISMSEVECIINLRDAWRFFFDNIKKKLDLNFILKTNSFIARNESLEWGVLRKGQIGISGTNLILDPPVEEEVKKELKDILKIKTPVSRAIYYYLWAAKRQLFWDGNKRTSMLIANKILINTGAGLFLIKEENLLEFNERLTKYYNTDDYGEMDDFLYEKCTFGNILGDHMVHEK